MLLLLQLLYNELLVMNKRFYRDPRTSFLPLLGSPWPMCAIIGLYLAFVLKWGPKWMEKRKAFDCKRVMQIYNVVQVVLNAYIFIEAMQHTYTQPGFELSCMGYNTKDTRPMILALRSGAYVYYITKYLDLLDTIFFVLRKKYNQISFLHVYHHACMIYGVWVYMTLQYGSHYTATGVLNSFVHVCMYSYYFVAAMKPNFDLEPWKRTLTKLQIVQFCLLTLHFARPIFNNWCGLDLFWAWLVFIQNLFMLILFSDFYYKAYILKDRRRSAKLAAHAQSPIKEHHNGLQAAKQT